MPALALLVACGLAAPPVRYDVPYRLTDTKHVMVRVKLNGKGPFNLICDTGAPAVYVTTAVAKAAGATPDGKGWAAFTTFDVEGGLRVPTARARVEDLFQLEGMNGMGLAGVELHGVIGYDLLARYRVSYDFTADKLVWEPVAGFVPPPLRIGKGAGGQGGLEFVGTLMKALATMMGVKVNFVTVPRGFVGVETEARPDGFYVKAVLPGGPADSGGLKADDRLIRVNGVDVDDARDLARGLAAAKPGDAIKFNVRRGGERAEATVRLGKGF